MSPTPDTWAPRAGGPRPCPRLSTARLDLGPLTLADWPAYRALLASDRASMMGGPHDDWACWGWFNTDLAGWTVTGTGAIALREKGTLRGFLTLNDFPMFPELEIGWMLVEGAEGQGFATEAAEVFRAWVRDDIAPASLVSYIDAQNKGSIGVATRLGAVYDPAAAVPSAGDLAYRHWGAA